MLHSKNRNKYKKKQKKNNELFGAIQLNKVKGQEKKIQLHKVILTRILPIDFTLFKI